MTEGSEQVQNQEFHYPALPSDNPIVIDGCGHKHHRQQFRFEGKGFFGRIEAAILNWMRRNCD